ncbi:MAG TPA: Crp/Fnr family transcriptional regulator [Polyangiaceae bacterium]|nr:Crp/Fnr family transcriptional regulator [Polyangiaceae bacterium]
MPEGDGDFSTQAYRWFEELDASARERVQRVASVRRLADREFLFEKGQPADGVFLVRRGLVACGSSSRGGREFLYFLLRRGESVGVASALDRRPHALSTWAQGETEVVHVAQAELERLLEEIPHLGLLLTKHVCQEFRFAYAVLEGHVFADLPVRMARMLVFNAQVYGRPSAQGVVVRNFTQERASHHLGVARQSVARVLREWRERAWVDTNYGRVVVRDLDALRRIAALERHAIDGGE